MTIEPIDLSPELGEVVARVRRAALEAGEIGSSPLGAYRSPVSREAGEAIIALLRDGTYAAAVNRVVAEDPELADA
jgi:hypothetical protein